MARTHLAGTSLGWAVVALLIAARAVPDTNSWESHTDTRAALLAAGDADSLEAAALLAPKKLTERLQLVLRAAAGTPQFDAALAGIFGSERFDIFWNQLIVHSADALKRTKTMEDREALSLAIGLGAAQAVPALQQLSGAC